MKKLVLILAVLFLASTSFGQLFIKQIAFATKSDDSLTASAGPSGTTKYFYYNNAGTVASGLVVSTTVIPKDYEIYAIEVAIALPTKAADMFDSCQITFEISYDNSNWIKWTNAGASTVATQTQYRNGNPKVFGSGVYTYLTSARDMVTTTSTAGGCVFMPVGCVAPYSRVKITSFTASSNYSAYPAIYYILKKL
ncbi:MAG: hypothetical protein M0P47_09200 [Bacteroidales bacterium]|nr:hypothetical protein [Bacteroidales bacterium]